MQLHSSKASIAQQLLSQPHKPTGLEAHQQAQSPRVAGWQLLEVFWLAAAGLLVAAAAVATAAATAAAAAAAVTVFFFRPPPPLLLAGFTETAELI